MLPPYLHRFFWDHPVAGIDEEKHSFFVIERLLEHGNDDAIRWVIKRYTEEKIINVVKKSRSLSAKTSNFWKNYFNLQRGEVFCLQKSSQQTDLIYWPG